MRRSAFTGLLQQCSADSKGNSVVEFAIAVPLILMIGLAGLEFSFYLRQTQITAAISREAASVAYRNCASAEANLLELCLIQTRDQITGQVAAVTHNAEVILSVYEMSGGAAQRSAIIGGEYGFAATDAGKTRKTVFSALRLSSVSDKSGAALHSHEVLVIAEVYVPYSAFIPMARNMLALVNGAIYDATII